MIKITECPYCDEPVTYRWENDFVSELHNILVADCVWHAECWDKQQEKYLEETAQ